LNLGFIAQFLQIIFNIAFTLFLLLCPIVVIIIFFLLELFVAVLQAYVFAMLVVIYLRDVVELH
jgi:F0F1-type ATP synthase membrane subunit a